MGSKTLPPKSKSAAKPIQLSYNEILQILPQKPPFVMLDHVDELQKNKIRASQTLKLEGLFFQPHYREQVQSLCAYEMIIAEAMGQAGIIFVKYFMDKLMKNIRIYLGAIDVCFCKNISETKKELIIEVLPVKVISEAAILSAKTYEQRKIIAEGQMSFFISGQ